MRHEDMGGFAFPRQLPDVRVSPCDALRIIEQHSGMTLWDYFAAAALTGFTSASDSEGGWTGDTPGASREAALIADAMLEERQKRMGGSDAA